MRIGTKLALIVWVTICIVSCGLAQLCVLTQSYNTDTETKPKDRIIHHAVDRSNFYVFEDTETGDAYLGTEGGSIVKLSPSKTEER